MNKKVEIFLMSGFLPESEGPSPLSKSSKDFQKYFCFPGDIHENISDFRVMIPGSRENGSYMTPIFFFAFKS